ncbi:MAG: aquaporin [candidate division Zixibacteria bacterium]|nr:aquaporin [candidate division Zixibacteria bacterium]
MDKTFKPALTEMVASFIFVAVAAGVVCANAMTRGEVSWVGIALANCFVFTALLALTTQASGGHISPAVTLGHWAARRIPTQTAVIYIVAQLAGAIVAGLVLRSIFPNNVWQPVALGAPIADGRVGLVSRIFVEALFTCIFVTTAIACTTSERTSTTIGPLAVGCALGFCTLVAGPLTGAGFNPARAFGSAIGSGNWNGQWPYWVGPIIGGLVAPFVHRAISGTTGTSTPWGGVTEREEPKVTVRQVKR